jgi:ubiquitin carboxyl-terminal hydrolase 8
MNIETYKDKGLSGLTNLGNTCFINSCMQVISHTYELNFFLEQKIYKNKLKKKYISSLIIEWDNLRKLMWSNNCVISPTKFLKTIQTVAQLKEMEMFSGYSQNDLPEFLLFLIDCFHTSLSREIKMTITGNPENETDKIAIQCFEMIKNMYSKEYSEIWNIFYAVHVSELTNLKTGEKIKITPEPYFMIDLPIPENNKSPSLIDCFNYYVEGEILEGDNGWYNEDTKERIDIIKKIQFWSFPNILVIDLKRFNNRFQKNQILVTFPIEELDLSNYIIGYKKNNYKYELYGICNHSGGVMGGHYTAYVKNANGKWYHFNDANVSEVGIIGSIISPKAYVLFYRKKSI